MLYALSTGIMAALIGVGISFHFIGLVIIGVAGLLMDGYALNRFNRMF